jgi:serine/threonine protein kinase
MPGRDIFLSYSSQDETIVGLALEKLEAAGHRCWFAPRDISPGEFYAGLIIQALRESRFVLLFFSAHSNASDQVVREINFAVSQQLPLLVVRLDQTALSNHLEYLIRINQWLDVTHLSRAAERIDKIVSQVETSLAKSGPKTSTAKAPVAMVFGDFQILADSSGKPIELGRGGMGVTYRARQISMGGREVALKVIQPELLGDDNVRRRFLREAQLAGDIDHENVALVHLRGQEGDSYFYAMQLVEGVDLDRLVKAKGPLSVRHALSVTAQVASALAAANAKDLIHRDIKPSNIMAVRRRNTLRIKLIDFGLAKQIAQQDIHSSLSGKDEFKGTLAYASPEQCQAFPLDTRSDLYSLGVTLWFLLAGKVPFTGNLMAVSAAHIWAPLPLEQLPPLPEAVLELLKSLLAKNPADRPQTPDEVEDRAEALLRSLPDDAVSDSAATKVQPAASSDGSVGPEADSTLIGAPVLVSYLEPAAGQIREDRFELLESLPEGVSGRLFRAHERRGSESRIVAVKFLHPSICAQEEAADSLKTQFAALQKLTLDPLIRYFALELGSEPPFLVREWVQGIPLTGVLRLKTGTLNPAEISALLEPLPGLLDALASRGLSLITVRLSKLWARLPPDLGSTKFESWVKQAKAQDLDSRLALDPLSLRSLVSRSAQSESDVTLLPTSRSLALQQNRAGIQGRTPAQLLASVVYELLAGQAPQIDSYRPVAAIPDTANQRLKLTLAQEGPAQSTASELWIALKTEFPQASKVPPPDHQQRPKPAANTGSAPSTPAKPITKPSPPPKPDPSGTQETNRTRLWLTLILSFAIFICVILLAFWLTSHSTPVQPSPTPTPEPTVSPSPTPTVSSTPTTTPITNSSNEELARESNSLNDRGAACYALKQYDEAVADFSEAIRLKPDSILAYRNRANCYDAQGRKARAERDRAKAESLEKGSPEPSASHTPTPTVSSTPTATASSTPTATPITNPSNSFNDRGAACYALKQYDEAVADFSEAIRLKSDSILAYRNRANCYDALGKKTEAKLDREKADKLENGNPEPTGSQTPTPALSPESTVSPTPTPTSSNDALATAAFGRGQVAAEKGDYQTAIADYSEVIRLRRNDARASLYRGRAYYALKQYDGAIADLSEALRLIPDTSDAFYNALFSRAYAYYAVKQYDKATADYSELIHHTPGDAQAYRNRADCYDALGKTVEAERDRAKAEKLEKARR